MPARVIAIGDIHGCSAALGALLSAIRPTPRDQIVTLGDYVDRGPDSRGVIETLLQLAEQCQLVALVGNHERMMLSARRFVGERRNWLLCGGMTTLTSYGGDFDRVPERHWEFLSNLRPCHETATHFFIHANYLPDVAISEQPEEIALWEHLVYSTPGPHQSGKIAVVGHTPQSTGDILDLGHLLAIDTYCVGKGYLTGICVETGEIWQVDKHGQARSPGR